MSPNEKQMLEILEEAGGKLHIMHLASRMGLSATYARTIASSLGRRDYLHVPASVTGKVRLLDKGWAALGKNTEGGSYNEGRSVTITY